ncbi:MAG: hypothetical protein K8R64_06350 [Methanosarcinaceae archaeon]|nr:hypothetical protein [Methanosarcinaceae archaeon]
MQTIDREQKNTPSRQAISSFEMGRDDVNILCTYGKISVWFGQHTPDVIIGYVLIDISNIDKSAVHETDIICDFEEITDYEKQGYTLVTYARYMDAYRATFHIPFHNKKALFHLAESITVALESGEDVNVDVYWNGDDADITRLSSQLNKIDDWKIRNITYKEDSKE